MKEKNNTLDNSLNDALRIATAIAYTKNQIDKLRCDSQELQKHKNDPRQVLVEYVQGP